MRKKIIAVVTTLAVCVGGFAFWQNRSAHAAAQSNATASFSTSIAKRDRIEVTVKGTAAIAASEKRTIKAGVAGKVDQVLIADGQPVKAGQGVVLLTNEGLVHQLELAQVELQAQRVRLDAIKSPSDADVTSIESALKQAQSDLKDRQRDIARLQVSSPIAGHVTLVKVNPGDLVAPGQLMVTVVDDTEVFAVVQVAQNDIARVKVSQRATVAFGSELPPTQGTVYSIGAEAQGTVRKQTISVQIRFPNDEGIYRAGLGVNATIKTGGEEDVSAGGVVTPKAKYEMVAEVAGNIDTVSIKEGDNVKPGQALVKIENQSLEAAARQASARVKTANESFLRVKSGLAPDISESDARTQALKAKQAEIELSARQHDVNNLTVRSPIDGVVVSHSVSSGDEVNASAVLCQIADYSKMSMVIPVDELDVSTVFIGQEAKITVEALPGRAFRGEVTKIATEGVIKDGVATYEVTVTLLETNGLRCSMTATATIKTQTKDNALLVPSEAVRNIRGKRVLQVMRDGRAEAVEVTVGLSNGSFTEILSGISDGDSVQITQSDRKKLNPFTGQEG